MAEAAMRSYARRFALLLKSNWYENREQKPLVRLGRWLAVFTYPLYRCGVYVVMSRSLAEPLADVAPAVAVSAVRLSAEHLPALESITTPADGQRLAQLLARGSKGFGVMMDGRIIGYGWVSFTLFPDLHRVVVPLRPGEAFIHDVFVLPSFRRKRVAAFLQAFIFAFLRRRGYTCVLCHIFIENRGALAFHRKLGYIEVGRLVHRRILWWDWFRYTPQKEGEHA
ncbi:MAG: GNAT family N-acetyltransferase [Caldilineae bacterium]|nr:MAG: GNAT family N-acetyltransferase [Caldilineae bacterium]